MPAGERTGAASANAGTWPESRSGARSTNFGVLIDAVFADGYRADQADEAVRLVNVGSAPIDIGGWSLGDGAGWAGFPPESWLDPGERWWVSAEAPAFAESFGHPPDWAWGEPGERAMVTRGGGPKLADSSDEVVLLTAEGQLADAARYGRGDDNHRSAAWRGAPVDAYSSGAVWASHQVLYRKLDPRTALPMADTDTREDWASDAGDVDHGRRARYPGWELEERIRSYVAEGDATLEAAVAPDGLYAFLQRQVARATQSIDVLAYTFDHPGLATQLADKASAGVRVRLLLDGGPAGGIDLRQRWCLARLHSAGVEVWWLDSSGPVRARYVSAHAKLWVIDDRWAVVATENPTLASAPEAVGGANGAGGRRGFAAATDLEPITAWAKALVESDLDRRHLDVRPYQPRDPKRGDPPPGYDPSAPSPPSRLAPFGDDYVRHGRLAIEAFTAPEAAIVPGQGLLGLIERAGSGDAIDGWQLKESLWWSQPGAELGDIERNPRLAALVGAARRGAHIRLLLDSYFDDSGHWNSNRRTAVWLNRVAAAEGLDLEARVGNPMGAGIHAKTYLFSLASSEEDWVHLGSLNGSEASSKVNREVAWNIADAGMHARLSHVFDHDWDSADLAVVWLPAVSRPTFRVGVPWNILESTRMD